MAAKKDASFFVHSEATVRDIAAKVVETQEEDNSFFICDLLELKSTLELWRQQLPRVIPYFAIKSCTDRIVIRTLAMEGVNFDCSNKREIQTVLSAGVDPSRIIYANPAKQSSHLEFAESAGVTLMTFDCLEELQKIKDKNARLLLRILPQEETREERMARKYGCRCFEAEHILRVATDEGHTVVGIAFHIGGRHFNYKSYRVAIEKARHLFDLGAQMGIEMTVLDIGGGFLGSTRMRDSFIQVCETVRSALDEHFPRSSGTYIIAEPGQYMVTSSYTLAVKVVAKRTRQMSVDGELCPYHDVYINDSKQNCIPRENYDILNITYHPLSPPHERVAKDLTTLWGATCHPMDKFEDHVPFYAVSVGEWLLMDNVGAYGLVKACGFNGTGFPPVHYRTLAADVPRVCSIVEESHILPGYSQPQSVVMEEAR
ncbi:ornithine decarboxylase 1-like isoform X1 [Dermacentor variabilis]|uniref:ornithine decarboxylase 1-like isoform X1 n=2 Tax=Dermacentor variabilis TaxID=34621 RepID=UPI003F5C226A